MAKNKNASKVVTEQMLDGVYNCITEFGTVKTAGMIRQLYEQDQLSTKQAVHLMLFTQQYYFGTNFSNFDL